MKYHNNKRNRFNKLVYFFKYRFVAFFNAFSSGNSSPDRNLTSAPPPVLVRLTETLYWSIAAIECLPPTTENVLALALHG